MRFDEIVTLEQLYQAWKDFSVGKRKKKDVMSLVSIVLTRLCVVVCDKQQQVDRERVGHSSVM
ncbi:MAG: hypothetical protein WC654_06180 [Patescibacteria group bacterium]